MDCGRDSYSEEHNPTATPTLLVEGRSEVSPPPEDSTVPDDIPAADSTVANRRLISDNGVNYSGSSIGQSVANVVTPWVGNLEETPPPSTSDSTIAINRLGSDLSRGILDLHPSRSAAMVNQTGELSNFRLDFWTRLSRLFPLRWPSSDTILEQFGVTLRPDPREVRLDDSTTMFNPPRGFLD